MQYLKCLHLAPPVDDVVIHHVLESGVAGAFLSGDTDIPRHPHTNRVQKAAIRTTIKLWVKYMHAVNSSSRSNSPNLFQFIGFYEPCKLIVNRLDFVRTFEGLLMNEWDIRLMPSLKGI